MCGLLGRVDNARLKVPGDVLATHFNVLNATRERANTEAGAMVYVLLRAPMDAW